MGGQSRPGARTCIIGSNRQCGLGRCRVFCCCRPGYHAQKQHAPTDGALPLPHVPQPDHAQPHILKVLLTLKTHCIRGWHIALRFCLGDQALSLSAYGEIVAETVQPANLGLATKPGELALGIVAVTLAGGGNGLLQRERRPQDTVPPDGTLVRRAPAAGRSGQSSSRVSSIRPWANIVRARALMRS